MKKWGINVTANSYYCLKVICLKGKKKFCIGFWERSEFRTNILLGTNSVKDWPMTNNNKSKRKKISSYRKKHLTFKSTLVCMHICVQIYVHMCVCVSIYVNICLNIPIVHISTYLYMYICLYILHSAMHVNMQ